MAKLTTAEFIDAIKELSVLELNELVKACEEEFGVSAAAGVVVAAAGAGAAAAENVGELISVHEVYHTREEIGLLVTYPRKAQLEAKTELAKAHFSIVWYAFEEAPSIELKKNLETQKAVVEAKKKVFDDLQ